MKHYRKFPLYLMLVLLLVSIIGCSTNSTSGSTTSQASTTSQTNIEATTEAPTSLLPYDGDPIVYTGLILEVGMDNDESTLVLQEYRKALGNVKIEWESLPGSDWTTKLNLALSSGDLPDVIWRNMGSTVSEYGNSGYFLNLAEYPECIPNWLQIQAEFPSMASYNGENGEIWAVGDVDPMDVIHETFYVNLTNLNELDIEQPETWDEAIAAMIAFKTAHPDSTPMIAYWDSILSTVTQSLNGYTDFFFNKATGKWDYMLLNDDVSHYKAIITIMHDLYDNGLIGEYNELSLDMKNQILMNGEWLFAYLTGSCVESYAFSYTTVPYEYDLMPIPAAAGGQPHYNKINYRAGVPTNGYFASAKVDNPELLASYLDYIISPEASVLWNWGIEGVSYDIDSSGKKYFLDDYATSADKRKELGISQFIDVRMNRYKDHSAYVATMVGKEKELYTKIANWFIDGTLTPYAPARGTPVMTIEANEIVSQNMTPMNTFINEAVAKFIDGTSSLDDWNAFVQEALDKGDIQAVLECYESGSQVVYNSSTFNYQDFD